MREAETWGNGDIFHGVFADLESVGCGYGRCRNGESEEGEDVKEDEECICGGEMHFEVLDV